VLIALSQVGIGRRYAAVLWLVAMVLLLVALVLATVDWRRHRRHRG
jgi:cytochrome c-type biogenesis protein CcmH/NrfF